MKSALKQKYIKRDYIELGEWLELHIKLNKELNEKFNIDLASFDGEGYHFHSTLFHNTLKHVPFEAYEKACSKLKEMNFNIVTVINEIAMFVSNSDEEIAPGTFITYKVLSLNDKVRRSYNDIF